jgi:hypothetical protein
LAHASRRRAALLLIAPILAALVVAAAVELHATQSQPRTPVAIDRTSLLPHRYAGPCINCHRIVEVGPVALSRDNMAGFALSGRDRRLLAAGQSVVVPSVSERFRIPAITRTDHLPHAYVGVCSNCHVVLDLRPNPAFLEAAMYRASQPLVDSGLPATDIARAGVPVDFGRARYRIAFGVVAFVLLVATSIWPIVRHADRGERWAGVHRWAGGGFVLAVVLHWGYSDRGNNLLHLAFVAAVWLAAVCSLSQIEPVRRLLLPAQRFVLLALILLAGVGHLLARFR